MTTTWGSTTNAMLALRDHPLAAEVTLVVIEATSDCWKPFYYLLAKDLNVILVNARQVKTARPQDGRLRRRLAVPARRPWPGHSTRIRPGKFVQRENTASDLRK